MCNVQADGISFKVVAGVHWAAAIRHIASVPEDRQLLEARDRPWYSSWTNPNRQVSRQHLTPVPTSPVMFYLRSELNNAEISLLQGGLASFVLMLQSWQRALHGQMLYNLLYILNRHTSVSKGLEFHHAWSIFEMPCDLAKVTTARFCKMLTSGSRICMLTLRHSCDTILYKWTNMDTKVVMRFFYSGRSCRPARKLSALIL